MKTDLENQSITDEELIERLNEAAGIENETQQKHKRNTCLKVTKVNKIQADVQVLQRLGERVEGQNLMEGATAKGKEMRVQSYTSKWGLVSPQDCIMTRGRSLTISCLHNSNNTVVLKDPERHLIIHRGSGDVQQDAVVNVAEPD